MKLTKEQLKQIIREELSAVLEVNPFADAGTGLPRHQERDRRRAAAKEAGLRSLARQHRELEKPEKSEGWVLHWSGQGKYYIDGKHYGTREQAKVFEFEEQAKHYADHVYKEEGFTLVPEKAQK